ncbi:MAG: sugar ABC transporter permease [Anaeroplasmataceae bacterium]|nr:sugar ABC transporter permease [Anaeroplasmataceae bacterium]
METKNNWKAWIYLAPAIILLAVFTFYPMINTIGISFIDGYKLSKPTGSFGIENYAKILTNKQFLYALRNTFIIAFVTVPLSTILALLIAVGLNSIKPLRAFLQTIYFLPYVTNSIAIGMVFSIIFKVYTPNGTLTGATNLGLFNQLIGVFGIKPQMWISQNAPLFNKMFVICFYIIWNALPFKIMILLGALQSVNTQYYNAAKIDGASRFKIFRKITVPLISPMLLYVVVTGFIGSFKEYSSVIGIFGENLKDFEMNTMVGLIYDSLSNVWTGRAAAGAVVLFLIILVFTGLQFLVSKKKVHY